MGKKKIIKWGIEGFRSIGDYTNVDIKPITLICGENSSGKSSFINSILLLSQAVIGTPVARHQPSLPLNGPLINLGPDMKKIIPLYIQNKTNFEPNYIEEEGPEEKMGITTKIHCLIDDGSDSDGDASYKRFTISLGLEGDKTGSPNIKYPFKQVTAVLAEDARGSIIPTNVRAFEIGSTVIMKLDDETWEVTDTDLEFTTHLSPLENTLLISELGLSEEGEWKLYKDAGSAIELVVGGSELDPSLKENFPEEYERLKKLGTPTPSVHAKLRTETEIQGASNEMTSDVLSYINDKVIQSGRYFKKNNDDDESNTVTSIGSIFNSGIPNGFLQKALQGDESLDSIKSLLLETVNPSSIQSELEDYYIDRNDEVTNRLDAGLILENSLHPQFEDEENMKALRGYDGILQRYRRDYGTYLKKVPKDVQKYVSFLRDLWDEELPSEWVHNDELQAIFENSKESLLRSETLDSALEQTSKWSEEYRKINEYWRKEYPPKRLEEETVEDSLYDIYIPNWPERAGLRWSTEDKEELVNLFKFGSKGWQKLDSSWDEFDDQGLPEVVPLNWNHFHSFNKEVIKDEIIPPYDIKALSDHLGRTDYSIGIQLLNENIDLKDVLFSLDEFDESGWPLHAMIQKNIDPSFGPLKNYEDFTIEDLIFRGGYTTLSTYSFPLGPTGTPISLGETFWKLVAYSYGVDKSNDPEKIILGLIKFLDEHINITELLKNQNKENLVESIVTAFSLGSVNEYVNFFEDTDFLKVLDGIDLIKETQEKYYRVQDIVDYTGAIDKSIRARLRKEYKRPDEEKGAEWELTLDQFIEQVEHWGIEEEKREHLEAGLEKAKRYKDGGLKKVLVAEEEIRDTGTGRYKRELDSASRISDVMSILEKIKYLGPLRSSTQRKRDSAIVDQIPLGRDAEFFNQYFHNWKDQAINAVIPKKNKNDWNIDLNNIQEGVKLEEAANKWFEYFGIAKEFYTKPSEDGEFFIGEVQPVDLLEKDRVSTKNIGVGFSQIAPIIVLSLMAEDGDLIILEEPESNLHPDAQRMLGEFFVAMEASGKYFIIETHSDHLINRLRLKVAESTLGEESTVSSETIGIYFAEKEEGQTKYKKAKLDEDGTYDMSDYPKGFFNQATKDALKLLSLRNKK